MIYTIEKRIGRNMGSLESWYEVRTYTHRSEVTGCLLGGETIASFDSKKEAKAYCKANGIEVNAE